MNEARMNSGRLKPIRPINLRTVSNQGRRPNVAYRVREHLTEAEIDKLLVVLKQNRHGHRDWLIGLLIYRHGLRVSGACDLRWDDIDWRKSTIVIRRLKRSHNSAHYMSEMNSLASGGCNESKILNRPMCSPAKRGQPFGAWVSQGSLNVRVKRPTYFSRTRSYAAP